MVLKVAIALAAALWGKDVCEGALGLDLHGDGVLASDAMAVNSVGKRSTSHLPQISHSESLNLALIMLKKLPMSSPHVTPPTQDCESRVMTTAAYL